MKFILEERIIETSDVATFIWSPSEKVSIKPGQYLHYVLEHENPDDRGIERWFTNSAAPFENHISITTRNYGDKASSFKKALFNLKIGQSIEADTPEGDFTIEDLSKKYIFIAGGIGITPFRSILKQLTHDGLSINVDLMYANRNDEFVFDELLKEMQKVQTQLNIHKFVSPKRIAETDIKEIVEDIMVPTYYISGPKPMVFAYRDLLLEMGISKDQIKLDDFPGYEEY